MWPSDTDTGHVGCDERLSMLGVCVCGVSYLRMKGCRQVVHESPVPGPPPLDQPHNRQREREVSTAIPSPRHQGHGGIGPDCEKGVKRLIWSFPSLRICDVCGTCC